MWPDWTWERTDDTAPLILPHHRSNLPITVPCLINFLPTFPVLSCLPHYSEQSLPVLVCAPSDEELED